MSALAMNDDSQRTPLAAVLSVLLHGAVAAAIVAYFWLHVSARKPSPYVFELFAPPLAATDSPEPGGGQNTPANNITLPSLANLPPAPVNLPAEPTPPVPAPQNPPPVPTPPTPANRSTTAPTRNTRSPQQTTYEDFQRSMQRSSRATGQRQNTSARGPARPNLNVGIDATAIANGVRGLGGSTRGQRNGSARGRADYNDYLARLVALLKAAFELPPGASGLTASVELTIAANGRVSSRTILRKSGNDAFDAAVQAALNSLTFVDPPPSGQQETFTFIFQPDQ